MSHIPCLLTMNNKKKLRKGNICIVCININEWLAEFSNMWEGSAFGMTISVVCFTSCGGYPRLGSLGGVAHRYEQRDAPRL